MINHNNHKIKVKQNNHKRESKKKNDKIYKINFQNNNYNEKYFPNEENSKGEFHSKVKITDDQHTKTDITIKKDINLSSKKEKLQSKKKVEVNKLNYKNNEIKNDNNKKYNFKKATKKNSSKKIIQKNNNQIININLKNNLYNNKNNDNFFSPKKVINKKKSSNNNYKKKDEICDPQNINIFQNNMYNINNNLKINNNNEIINFNPNHNPIYQFSMDSYKNPPLVILDNGGKKITYMNMVLQCFANIRNTTSEILKNLKIIENQNNQTKIPILFHYSRILYHLFNLDNKNIQNYNFEIFYKMVITINPIFKGKTTKNAIDFLLFFIDKLDEEFKTITNNNTNINKILKKSDFQIFYNYLKYLKANKEDTIILYTFAWFNKKIEKCWECNKENIIFRKYFTYDLNIENAINKSIIYGKYMITIHDCIKYSSENQIKYNIFCDGCKNKNNKDIKSTIYFSPCVLIFLFREIEKKKNIEDMESNYIQIKIDKDIDLSDLVDNEHCFNKYTLHGLILYDLEKNEYFAYCVSPIDGNWYKYTDGNIQFAKLNDFIDSINYKILPVILFYRHLEEKK